MRESQLFEKKSENHELISTDANRCFDAYVEGNLRMPQSYDMGSLLLASALFEHGMLDLGAFARHRLSKEHTDRLKEAMHRAHAARHVPAAARDSYEKVVNPIRVAYGDEKASRRKIIVTDERLAELWNDFRAYTIGTIGELAGLKDGQKGYLEEGVNNEQLTIIVADDLDEYLRRRPRIVRHIQGILKSFVESIRSPEGLRITAQYRDVLAHRNIGPAGDDAEMDARRGMAAEIGDEMVRLLATNYRSRWPWKPRIIRDMLRRPRVHAVEHQGDDKDEEMLARLVAILRRMLSLK